MGLPETQEVRERLTDVVDKWRSRNALIDKVREMLNGKNPVKVPEKTQYEAKIVHSRLMRASVNEKVARFKPRPDMKVFTRQGKNGRVTAEGQREASNLEDWLRHLWYWCERNAGTSAWLAATRDVHCYEMGCLRVDRAPAAFWPDLVIGEDGKDKYSRIFENDPKKYATEKEKHKQEMGPPLRIVHVPVQNFYPAPPEGGKVVEAFEVDRRPLKSVFSNPLFDTDGIPRPEKMGYGQMCTVVQFSNQTHHAYYLLSPASGSEPWSRAGNANWPSEIESGGQLHLLYAYEHKLGEPLYVVINGAEGGWFGDTEFLEGRIESLLKLNQDMDDILSQGATNLAATFWPTMVFKSSLERPQDDRGQPEFTIEPGGVVKLWEGETINPMFEPKDNPLWEAMIRQVRIQYENIAGSAVAFGERQPGVRTAVQHELILGQTEHLDSRTEDGLIAGAIDVCHKLMRHVVAMDEEVPVESVAVDKGGKKFSRYITAKPADLRPLPMMDASVRARRAMDMQAAITMALQAGQDRTGPGTPLLSDDTIHGEILQLDAPDQETRKIDLQNYQKALKTSDEMMKLLLDKVKVRLIQNSAPPTPSGPIDPALAMTDPSMGGMPPDPMDPMGGVPVMPPMGPPPMGDPMMMQMPPPMPPPPQIPGGPGMPGMLQGIGGGRIPGQMQMEQMPMPSSLPAPFG